MIVPPSALLDGLFAIWPYLLGGVGLALAIGFAIPRLPLFISATTIIRKKRAVKISTIGWLSK